MTIPHGFCQSQSIIKSINIVTLNLPLYIETEITIPFLDKEEHELILPGINGQSDI